VSDFLTESCVEATWYERTTHPQASKVENSAQYGYVASRHLVFSSENTLYKSYGDATACKIFAQDRVFHDQVPQYDKRTNISS
jgi:hypothetical protein